MRNIDLNLLVYLDALLDEGNISNAAKRLHISQPALSNALARLRAMFGDHLLIRSQEKMVKTPFADSIRVSLKQALQKIEHEILAKKQFDPTKYAFLFSTAFHGYEEAIAFPVMVQTLSHYPHLTIKNRTPNRYRIINELNHSLVHFTSADTGEYLDIKRRLWLIDEFICIVNRDFDEITLNAATYYDQNHLLITPQGEGSIVDQLLIDTDRKRNIRVGVSEFGYAPILLSNNKTVVSTVPQKVAALWAHHFPLKMLPCPLKLPPLKIFLSWHKSADSLPALTWFKEQLLTLRERSDHGRSTSPTRN